MPATTADPLRSTLDKMELDPRSESDRPYLIAMLRRLGYTERDIEEVIRTGKLPATAPTATDLAPARDYHLVVAARDSRFALDNTGRGGGRDAPFEDLERLEFEDPTQDVVFEDLDEQATTAGAGDQPFDSTAIDTFGEQDAAAQRGTRVRVRRVRAASREEAERKVEGHGRHVIKSVPVDIVERWGAADATARDAKKEE